MLVKSKIKYIQSLGQKKVRDEDSVFVAEGPKIIAELESSPAAKIIEMYAVKEWLDEHNHLFHSVDLHEVSNDELAKISHLATPNQVVAIVRKFEVTPISAANVISLALDTIQDPGNLGTIIRNADWFGIGQIICSHECADQYNPKVVQSTMGSMARVNVHYTALGSWLAKQQDIPIFGATLDGREITSLEKPTQGIIVIGNESRGISDEIMNLLTVKITISRKGNAESLNAAVATGIILSHLVN